MGQPEKPVVSNEVEQEAKPVERGILWCEPNDAFGAIRHSLQPEGDPGSDGWRLFYKVEQEIVNRHLGKRIGVRLGGRSDGGNSLGKERGENLVGRLAAVTSQRIRRL